MDTKNILNAEGHFGNIRTEAVPVIEEAGVYHELVDKGRTKEDINIAIQLMACIDALNGRVLPEPDVLMLFHPEKHEYDFPVEYVLRQQRESFDVFVDGIASTVDESTQQEPLLLSPQAGLIESYDDIPTVSFEECLFAMAIHEIRHRLQHNGLARLFSISYAKHCADVFLKNLMLYVHVAFLHKRAIYLRQGMSSDYMNLRLSPREFDAVVVTNFVKSRLHDGLSMVEMQQLLTIQPS